MYVLYFWCNLFVYISYVYIYILYAYLNRMFVNIDYGNVGIYIRISICIYEYSKVLYVVYVRLIVNFCCLE